MRGWGRGFWGGADEKKKIAARRRRRAGELACAASGRPHCSSLSTTCAGTCPPILRARACCVCPLPTHRRARGGTRTACANDHSGAAFRISPHAPSHTRTHRPTIWRPSFMVMRMPVCECVECVECERRVKERGAKHTPACSPHFFSPFPADHPRPPPPPTPGPPLLLPLRHTHGS